MQKVGYKGTIQSYAQLSAVRVHGNEVEPQVVVKPTMTQPTLDEAVEAAVEDFENAYSFADARDAKSALYEFISQFTPGQVKRIVAAYADNSQVRGCFGIDETMLAFWEGTTDRAEAAEQEWTRAYHRLGNPPKATVRSRLKIFIRRRFNPPEKPVQDNEYDDM